VCVQVVRTASNYTDGSSERIVGELVREDRERFVIATKYTLSLDPNDPNAGGNAAARPGRSRAACAARAVGGAGSAFVPA